MFMTNSVLKRTFDKTTLLTFKKMAENLDAQVRMEKDTMGELPVPADKYYGCQTARSKINFPIGNPNSERIF